MRFKVPFLFNLSFIKILPPPEEPEMGLKDSISALQTAAASMVNTANLLISLAATLKSNAVSPEDVAAIDAVTAQLSNISASMQAVVNAG